MFRQQHYTQENNKSLETPQERIQRIKRTKNIRKEKVQKKRSEISCVLDSSQESSGKIRDKITREQKVQIQKEKNRIAAQQSRDKQKQHVIDLQRKVSELQTIVSKQLCVKCRDPFIQESKTNESSDDERFAILSNSIEEQPIVQNNLYQESPLQFFREQSSESIHSIGKFLFICMICVALISFSASFENAPEISSNNRFLQAIAPLNTGSQEKSGDIDNKFATSLWKSTTLQSTLLANNYKINSQKTDGCKNQYIENYFLENDELQLPEDRFKIPIHYNHDRLINCARPQLIMKKDLSEPDNNDGSFFSGLFTVVLDNPEIMEVINNKGKIYLDNVISLKGLYEIEVKFMSIKKVISHILN